MTHSLKKPKCSCQTKQGGQRIPTTSSLPVMEVKLPAYKAGHQNNIVINDNSI